MFHQLLYIVPKDEKVEKYFPNEYLSNKQESKQMNDTMKALLDF